MLLMMMMMMKMLILSNINIKISTINNKYNTIGNSYTKNFPNATYTIPYDERNYSMNVNPIIIPDKFKKNLPSSHSDYPIKQANDNLIITEDTFTAIYEEDVKKDSKKKDINSALDFIEQQREIKKPESQYNQMSSKKRSTDQLNSNDVLSNTVN